MVVVEVVEVVVVVVVVGVVVVKSQWSAHPPHLFASHSATRIFCEDAVYLYQQHCYVYTAQLRYSTQIKCFLRVKFLNATG
ncbi:hypothetical protein E2C01_071935 [Portunus trituberculatus]|uniref:Uncharacterized protein n=1 Tax=Portunus trituberculatus TaxID=210409 RepID=A0A5B7HWM8_PORTR|nr:hypothetical protein [Portunus trituberculatus]